ncbi:hypothetical protein HKD42_09710 [Altererythrobacter sp. RZ02]|uniref:Uncharacterized protein n=1 Tax=Pontixanthobacter rizhaonensis TaxID=2730337 RepID=A0A848QQD1_9SPHN|nr:hypothetical protein [Pontixanthobacter rizhaonensis]NMW32335.1 hypothetical protein [Pontixanthobacter rizhaonensis]
MTLSPSLSNKLFRTVGAASVALLYSTLTIGAAVTPTAAEARSSGPYYTVELAQPASESRMIVRGTVFRCEGTSCVAGKGTSRPVVMCQRLAREVGTITKFTSKGNELAADKLAKCNGK